MKKLKLIFVFIIGSLFSLQAQEVNNGVKHYKVTFVDIDQFQLKELIPVCSQVFDATAGNKGGEPNVLRFDSKLDITEEILKDKLEKSNLPLNFIIEIENKE